MQAGNEELSASRSVFYSRLTHALAVGLGKTLQIISVLLANPADGVIYAPASAEAAAAADAAAEGGDKYDGMSLKALQSAAAGKGLSKTGTKAQLAAKLRSAASTRASGSPAGAASAPPSPRPTLVVCPLSVASAWEEQLAHHVASGVLKVRAPRSFLPAFVICF